MSNINQLTGCALFIAFDKTFVRLLAHYMCLQGCIHSVCMTSVHRIKTYQYDLMAEVDLL